MKIAELRHGSETTFEDGVSAVRYIRCIKHREVTQYNQNEITGAECAACGITRLESEKATALEALRRFIPVCEYSEVRDDEICGALCTYAYYDYDGWEEFACEKHKKVAMLGRGYEASPDENLVAGVKAIAALASKESGLQCKTCGGKRFTCIFDHSGGIGSCPWGDDDPGHVPCPDCGGKQ